MRRVLIVTLLALVVGSATAQSFEEQFREFQHAAQKEYADFRDAANAHYKEFLRNAWAQYKQSPAVPKPKEEFLPPVIYDDKKQKQEEQQQQRDEQKQKGEQQLQGKQNQQDEQKPEEPVIQDNAMQQPEEEHQDEEITVVTIPQPEPRPQPEPISPVIENKQKTTDVHVVFYQTPMTFRFPKDNMLHIASLSGDNLVAAWALLASDAYENLLYDCLDARDTYQLSDWTYLQLLRTVAEKVHGHSNEAVLLEAFLYANSGYQMRLAASQQGKLYLLVGSDYILYDRGYFELDGVRFFPLEDMPDDVAICDGTFDQEKPFSLLITREPKLAQKTVSTMARTSQMGITATSSVNQNLIDLYNDYPTGQYGEDFGTRWAAYANAPMPEQIKKDLYPTLRASIQGSTEKQAVHKLLNWVQTGFRYKYDDEIWGQDRAFFPAESLYYPYCDCEDRSILFSRLVRDLIGLDVVLLYYPGHLATAVHFSQETSGDYLMHNGKRYVVCDPTFIGAPVGMTMTDMDNRTAKVIPLRK